MKIVLDNKGEGQPKQNEIPDGEGTTLPVATQPTPPAPAPSSKKSSPPVVVVAGVATLVIAVGAVGFLTLPKVISSAQNPQEQQAAQNNASANATLELSPGMTFAELDATAKSLMDEETYAAFIAAYENVEIMSEFSMFNGVELDDAAKVMYLPANSHALETITTENAEDVMRSLYQETEAMFEAYDNGFNPLGFQTALATAVSIEQEGISEDQKSAFANVIRNNRAYDRAQEMCIVSKHDFDAAANPTADSYCGYYLDENGSVTFVTADDALQYEKHGYEVWLPDGTLDSYAMQTARTEMSDPQSQQHDPDDPVDRIIANGNISTEPPAQLSN